MLRTVTNKVTTVSPADWENLKSQRLTLGAGEGFGALRAGTGGPEWREVGPWNHASIRPNIVIFMTINKSQELRPDSVSHCLIKSSPVIAHAPSIADV